MGYLSPCKTSVQTLEHIFTLSKKITMFVKITVHLKALAAPRVYHSFKHFGCIESFLVEYGILTSELGAFYICQTMHSVLSLSNILTTMHSVISSMTVASAYSTNQATYWHTLDTPTTHPFPWSLLLFTLQISWLSRTGCHWPVSYVLLASFAIIDPILSCVQPVKLYLLNSWCFENKGK